VQVPRPRAYNGLWSVPGITPGHICGNPAWFLAGVPAGTPPLAPAPDDIPACCPRALAAQVGAAVWPSSVVYYPSYPVSGGMRMGGPMPSPVPVSPVSGGMRMGGSVRATIGPQVSAPTGGMRMGGPMPSPVPVSAPTGGMRMGGPLASPVPVSAPTGGMRMGGEVEPSSLITVVLDTWYWVNPSDSLETVNWAVMADNDGVPGTLIASGTGSGFRNTGHPDPQGLGYEMWSGSFEIQTPPTGTYWVQLSGGTSALGVQFYWDISDGAALGYEFGEADGPTAGFCCADCSGSCSMQIYDLSSDLLFDNTNPSDSGTYYGLDTGCAAWDVSSVEGFWMAVQYTL
jgi:hypothetical protein